MADGIDTIELDERPIHKVDFVKDRGSQPISKPFVSNEAELRIKRKLAELANTNNNRPANSNTGSSNSSEKEESA